MPFRDVIGHRRLLALLARSIRRESLPPSLIFAGPAGVGKRLVAMAAAQAVNCLAQTTTDSPSAPGGADAPLELDACGTCVACVRIARGMHPDVLIVEPGETGSIKIEPIRDVVDRSGYRPFEGRRRVVVIDHADALVPAAQHALLKTLEEPPPSSMFLLLTTRPDALLPTVRSRCPRLRFQALGVDDVTAALMARGRNETEARAVAATADGSIGAALAATGDTETAARDVAVRALGEASGRELRRQLEAAKTLMAGVGSTGGRDALATELRAMASLLRDVALVGANGDRAALANRDVAPALERLSAYRGERGVQAFAAVNTALAALDRNASVKIVADWVALQL